MYYTVLIFSFDLLLLVGNYPGTPKSDHRCERLSILTVSDPAGKAAPSSCSQLTYALADPGKKVPNV